MTWSARAVALEGLVSPFNARTLALLGWTPATVALAELAGPYTARVTAAEVLAGATEAPSYAATARAAWLTMVPTAQAVLGASARLAVVAAAAAPEPALTATITRS